MNITDITDRTRAYPKRRRVGRGEGSGLGKTSGKGHKGHKARSDRVIGKGLAEGGNFPLFRRIPKLGFNNFNFRTEYQVVNVRDLNERFDNQSHVTAATLMETGLIRDLKMPVKILGDGELAKKLTVEAQRFSAEAEKKISGAGGTVKKLGPQPKKKFIKRPPVAEKAEEGGKGGKAKKGKGGPDEGAPEAAKPEGGEPKKSKKKGGEESGAAEA